MSSIADTGEVNRLRKNSLGVGAVTFLVVSAAAPLTAVAGGVPLSMLMGNGAGIPGTFALVTLLLLVFAVGYVAMARHIRNAGAFYAYTAQGLGGIMGGAAAWVGYDRAGGARPAGNHRAVYREFCRCDVAFPRGRGDD
jgi:amino acid transporter